VNTRSAFERNLRSRLSRSAAIPRGSSSLEFRRLRETIGTRPIAQKTLWLENLGKKRFSGVTGQHTDNKRTTIFTNLDTRNLSVSCDVLDPFFLSHRPIGNNVNGVGVCSLGRLRWLPIATIKQCACSRNSRSSWRFWIAHYSRKRFDGRSRIITGRILNVGQDSRPSVRISGLSWPKACAVCSSWHLPDIAC
jgi:hypothetical protein